MKNKAITRTRRHQRVRAKVFGTPTRPRLSVFRSNRYLYAQLIDDVAQRTVVGVHGKTVAVEKSEAQKQGQARAVGHELARRAVSKHITSAVFDRGGYQYQGRVRAAAEGARAGGLVF